MTVLLYLSTAALQKTETHLIYNSPMANPMQQCIPEGSSSEKFTIVVLGRDWRDGSDFTPTHCQLIEGNTSVIISTPSDLTDTDMLDLIALSDSKPNVFLLEEGRNPHEELKKWEKIFGKEISHNMICITNNHYPFDKRFNNKFMKKKDMKECKQIYHQQICAEYNFTGMFKRRKMAYMSLLTSGPGDQQHPSSVHLVLLGESGSGKSCSGNTILGRTAFISRPSSQPVTTCCKMESKNVYGTEVKVIDTPDFFDDELHMQSKHVMQCRQMTEGNLCVYLLVIQIGRFTEGERDILERLEAALQTRIRDRTIILFTRGDDLRSQSIEDYVRHTTPFLQQLIRNGGGIYQVFNNNNKRDDKQVQSLMAEIAKLVDKTDRVQIFPEYDGQSNSRCVLA